jgi:hydroxypyruvate isomerase
MHPLRLVANLSMQFTDLPDLRDRVVAAAAAGFDAVEFWRWEDLDLAALRETCTTAGVEIVSIVTDWTVVVADPAERERLVAAVDAALDAAEVLGVRRLVVPLGPEVDGQSREEAMTALAAALAAGAERARARGVVLLIEPLNTLVDHPGAVISTTADGLDLLRRIDDPAVRMLFDAYHSLTQGEDAAAEIRAAAPFIDAVQIADVPGRHELGTGSADWRPVAAALREVGYRGPLGLEFEPLADPAEALARSRAAWTAAWEDGAA